MEFNRPKIGLCNHMRGLTLVPSFVREESKANSRHEGFAIFDSFVAWMV